MKGFEDITILSIYKYEGNEKHIFSYVTLNQTDLFHVLSRIECTLVFDKLKLLSGEGKSIRKIIKRLPIFDYINVPIISVIEQIEKYFYKGQYGYFNDETGGTVLLVYKNSQILIADIISSSKEIINNRWREKNISFCNDVSNICDLSLVKKINSECHMFEVLNIEDVVINKKMKQYDHSKKAQDFVSALMTYERKTLHSLDT